MNKFLDQTGLATVWSKIKSYVTSAVDTAKTAVGNYTVNGKKISTNPTLTKSDVGLGSVTDDAQVKRTEMGVASGVATLGTDGKLTAAQLPVMKTVNGESVVGSGDITIDLSLFKVVETLPTTNIDANKVYLIKDSTGKEGNLYTEYMYVNGKWEELGKYKTDVDLTPYVKFTDLASAVKAGAMSAEDYKLLHDKAEEVDYLTKMTVQEVTVNGTSLELTDGNAVNIPLATATVDGAMSKTDKEKLDSQEIRTLDIDDGASVVTFELANHNGSGSVIEIPKMEALTEAEIAAICV